MDIDSPKRLVEQQKRANYGAELSCHARVAWQKIKRNACLISILSVLPLDANKEVIFDQARASIVNYRSYVLRRLRRKLEPPVNSILGNPRLQRGGRREKNWELPFSLPSPSPLKPLGFRGCANSNIIQFPLDIRTNARVYLKNLKIFICLVIDFMAKSDFYTCKNFSIHFRTGVRNLYTQSSRRQ